jgi:hypothetical protein
LPEAYLAGLTSTCILYGISVATYYACSRALFATATNRRKLTTLRWIMFAVATGMWVDATVGVGQMLQHMLNAFVHYKGEGGAEAGLSDIRDPMNIVHALTYPFQAAMGDSFLLYRTWVVYDRNWTVIALPFLILIGDIFAGFGITAAELSLHSMPEATATHPKIVPWTTSFFTLTLCLNVLCTGLIIGRIWRVSRNTASVRITESRVQQIGRIILESGLIYTISSLIVVIVVVTRSTALYIASDSFIPITAICFHLIIIRTETTREGKDSTAGATSTGTQRVPVSLRFASPYETTNDPLATTNGAALTATRGNVDEAGSDIVQGSDGWKSKGTTDWRDSDLELGERTK